MGFVLGIVVTVALSACAQAGASAGEATPPTQSPQTIVVAPGRTARVEGTPLSITLDAILDDSRCPVGVTCIWAGDVTARIVISGGDDTAQTAMLHLNRSDGGTLHSAHRVTLTAVDPAPKANQKIDPQSYRATFRIEKIQ